jgi:S-methylmethionine-dependent homocysteine/selenocysteine methylase
MDVTILDGGMGQELVARSGLSPSGLWSTEIMMARPDLVQEIHADYFAAGAVVATANTYAIHRDRLRPHGFEDRLEALHRQACGLACAARDAHGSGLVAGALGPLGWSYSHDGAPPEAQAAELYDEICRIQSDLVDLFLIETIASVEQARGALAGATGHGKPVWLALTVDDGDGTRLRSGEPLTDVLATFDGVAPDALLLNCSVPEAVTQGLAVLAAAGAGMPLGAYANGFTGIEKYFMKKGSAVAGLTARKDLTPLAYGAMAEDWVGLGATIVGGCCEVGPAHIAELTRRLGRRAA